MPTDHANAESLVTILSEAELLFNDEEWTPAFTPGIVARFMPELREQRKAGSFCDVVFEAADGRDVRAYRLVMASRFPGCRALFKKIWEEMSKGHDHEQEFFIPLICVVVRGMTSDLLELLVDIAYHEPLEGRIELHNVDQVLELAETCKARTVRDLCITMLKQNLGQYSYINTYRLAIRRKYNSLIAETFRYIRRNFVQLSRHCQFQLFTHEELRAILMDDLVQAPNEVDHTFRAILYWISADEEERKRHLAHLLPLVRFVQCDDTEFARVLTDPQVQADGDSIQVLNVIQQSLTRQPTAFRECAGVDLSSKIWLHPRIPSDILFIFGGLMVDATTDLYVFNARTSTWRLIDNWYTLRRMNYGVAVLDACVYIVGGHSGIGCCKSVVCFDVTRNQWSRRASMGQVRCGVSMATLQGYIYAMGGFDGDEHINTVERYDTKTNQWFQVAAMKDIRSAAAATTAAGRIYIVGGFTGREVLNMVETDNPASDSWTRVLTMSTPRSSLKVVAHNEIIYMIDRWS